MALRRGAHARVTAAYSGALRALTPSVRLWPAASWATQMPAHAAARLDRDRAGAPSLQPGEHEPGCVSRGRGELAAGERRGAAWSSDGSNGAEEKRKRRQKRLSFSLELIEHYGKKSLFCKRPPNPFYAGPGTQLEPATSARVKPGGDFFLFLAALNSVRAGLPRWPMRCIRPWSPEQITG